MWGKGGGERRVGGGERRGIKKRKKRKAEIWIFKFLSPRYDPPLCQDKYLMMWGWGGAEMELLQTASEK